jgi:hypothetical protein
MLSTAATTSGDARGRRQTRSNTRRGGPPRALVGRRTNRGAAPADQREQQIAVRVGIVDRDEAPGTRLADGSTTSAAAAELGRQRFELLPRRSIARQV